jgi:segregation and condensation protein A
MSIEVKLDSFEGPLELLLHLIKKEKVDIYDIPIADITRQYLEYIEKMQELNFYLAGEFMLMAATLIYIKSKMLLPKKVDMETEIAGEPVQEDEDPRAPLVRRLIEYQRIKDMMELLDKGEIINRDFFPRGYTEFKLEYFDDEFDAYELVKVFYELVKKMPDDKFLNIELESISVVDRMNEVMETLKERKKINFFEYAEKLRNRLELIVFFLSLLELTKLRLIYLRQLNSFADVEIGLRVKDVENGE